MMQSTLRTTSLARVSVTGMQQTRGMAVNPNDILKRITSTKSIEKITKSMKMVSAAKLRGDTQRLVNGRPFMEIMSKLTPELYGEDIEAPESDVKDPLLVAISSDRGLCGGVNSFVSKRVRLELEGTNSDLMVVGDKGSAQLSRTSGQSITCTVDEAYKNPMNFAKACNVTSRVLPAAANADAVRVVFNRFRTAVSYETMVLTVPNFTKVMSGPEGLGTEDLPSPLNQYEIEPDVPEDFVQNVYEYTLACEMFSAMSENATSEQSARMSAMDNASKNAGEMIDSLTVLYNRARQAKITTELNEIISGAESLKD